MFGKCEKKKGHIGAAVVVGMLAAVGVIAITNKGKEMLKKKGQSIVNAIKQVGNTDSSSNSESSGSSMG